MLSKSLKAAAGNAGGEAIYVDDVFSTYLYTGNFLTQTITNGIDLAGEGGLVWVKSRDQALSHYLGSPQVTRELSSNSTGIGESSGTMFNAYNANGFTLQSATGVNGSAYKYASWTFRKAPKFFDVVTYTGNGAAFQTLSHNLAATPGFVIVKRTDNTSNWWVRHISQTNVGRLNSSAIFDQNGDIVTNLTSTTFDVGVPAGGANTSGATYVAYLFAHDAGGFGAGGSENVISCGAFTTDGSGSATINLGYEPQFVLLKNTSGSASSWFMLDTMRGWDQSSNDRQLLANSSNAESDINIGGPNSTGFTVQHTATTSFIYIAIRRPNKPPTSGTEVFAPVIYTGTGAIRTITASGVKAPDLVYIKQRDSGGTNNLFWDKVRGARNYLSSNLTAAEAVTAANTEVYGWLNNGYDLGTNSANSVNSNGFLYATYMFTRAPGFFDVVCYTGNGGTNNVIHNLQVAPEIIIVKRRDSTNSWAVYHASTGNQLVTFLNTTNAASTNVSVWNSTNPSASVFTLAGSSLSNINLGNYIAYLFASLPGISKVGSYTGNGTSQTIDCGFTTGARFFLVKATSTTGSWWVYDSARGIVAAADPALQLNSTAAEVTSADAVDPTATGIIVNQEATCSINASGVSYIFLAIS